MRVKLDENLGAQLVAAFRKAGHDVATVADERLQGTADRQLIDAARAEERCLVTLDVEFGNPLVFRPSDYRGIAVLRLGAPMTHSALVACVDALLSALERADVVGKLWIVQPGRVREYQPEQ